MPRATVRLLTKGLASLPKATLVKCGPPVRRRDVGEGTGLQRRSPPLLPVAALAFSAAHARCPAGTPLPRVRRLELQMTFLADGEPLRGRSERMSLLRSGCPGLWGS